MVHTKKQLILSALLVFGVSVTGWANIPPPPVNQLIGIPDSSFNNLSEPDCRVCHEDQDIVNAGTLPDRHHLLVNTPLADPTAAPFVQTGDTIYQCLSCHQQEWDSASSSYVFVSFRDCLFCHEQIPGEASVHHLSNLAQSQNCKACHGPIDNPDDGHYIPTYAPSLVTPWPSRKPNPGENGEGQCVFCHDSGVDTGSGLLVLTNNQTHHSTGLGLNDSNQCFWCHYFDAPADENIRKCEACHGVASLHNIQVNSDNPDNPDTIVPGGENPYWGHIGHNDDCYGCHGFTAMSTAAPYSGPVVPDLSALSISSVTEGTAAVITASGNGFVNVVAGLEGEEIELTSMVVLTNSEGREFELIPSEITANSLTVALPEDLKAGNYAFRVAKADKMSNAVNLSVVPAMANQNILCRKNSITITGTGYSQYVDALNSGTGLVAVDLRGNEVDCTVRSWTDTKITATCSACPSTVTVNSIWGQDMDRTRSIRPRR